MKPREPCRICGSTGFCILAGERGAPMHPAPPIVYPPPRRRAAAMIAAVDFPACPRCGLALSARGCTLETCANPEGAAELERLRTDEARALLELDPEFRKLEANIKAGFERLAVSRWATFTPAGYVSLASTGAAVQSVRVCECDRCEADGQHAPMCAVHWEPPKACGCGKGAP